MREQATPPRPSLAALLQSGSVPQPAPLVDAEAGAAEQNAPAMAADRPGEAPGAGAGGSACVLLHAHEGLPQDGAAAPSFLQHPPGSAAPARRTPPWQWLLLVTLSLLLAVQVVIADRAALAADARWRPVVAGLCTALRCTLPAWHQPEAFTMLQREIRPLPGHQGVLQVQASFRNDARWAQAWPALRLSLSDADGRVVGRRVLQPGDYLGTAHQPRQRLEPGQSAQVSFLLREPSAASVAYTFEFL